MSLLIANLPENLLLTDLYRRVEPGSLTSQDRNEQHYGSPQRVASACRLATTYGEGPIRYVKVIGSYANLKDPILPVDCLHVHKIKEGR